MLITEKNWQEHQDRFPDFYASELASKDTGAIRVSFSFIDALQLLRTRLGFPMVITSGCRTKAHNTEVGGHPRSLHICDEPRTHSWNTIPENESLERTVPGTLAVDVRASRKYRGILFTAAWKDGWSVGWGDGFLHLDKRIWIGLYQTTFDY